MFDFLHGVPETILPAPHVIMERYPSVNVARLMRVSCTASFLASETWQRDDAFVRAVISFTCRKDYVCIRNILDLGSIMSPIKVLHLSPSAAVCVFVFVSYNITVQSFNLFARLG